MIVIKVEHFVEKEKSPLNMKYIFSEKFIICVLNVHNLCEFEERKLA